MTVIKATVRNGRIETETPVDLPDGTELRIPLPGANDTDEDDWDTTPEGIAAWLDWYDSLQPLKMTEEEEIDAETWLKRCDRHGAQYQIYFRQAVEAGLKDSREGRVVPLEVARQRFGLDTP